MRKITDLETLLQELYDNADMDFIMKESIALTNIEFKQTFREYKAAADYVYDLLQQEGLPAERYTFPADGKATYMDMRTPLAWEASLGRLTVVNSAIPFAEPVVADYERHPFHLVKGSTGTPEGGICTKVITEDQFLAGEDATGALLLLNTETRARSAIITPLLDRGGIGFISCCLGRGAAKETPDCVTWCNAATDDHGHWHVQSEDRDFIGFSVSPRTGDALRSAIAAGPLEVLVESDGRRYEGEIDAISSLIPGKSEKEIWLIAHLYEPFFADNSLSVIMAMEIAKKILQYGTPNFSLRLVFSMETYGLPAVWERLAEKVQGKVLGALDIDTPPAYTFDKIFKNRLASYAAPFFGNYLFLMASKAYEFVFPGLEKCVETRVEYGDDLILGDPTVGVPTIYFEEAECRHHHSSYWALERVEADKVRRSYALVALWTFMMVYLDEESVQTYLPSYINFAKEKLVQVAETDNSRERMEYFLAGEKALVLDFKRAVDIPEIEEAANTLEISPQSEETLTSPALEKAAKIIVSRETIGFPFDLIKIPYAERRPLPDSNIYGPFAVVIAGLDGKRNLRDVILGALWERKCPVTDERVESYIEAVSFLADAGYLSIKGVD